MKQSKKINQLKQSAIEIKNKQQLNKIKGGVIVDADFREVVGADDLRTGVHGNGGG